MARARAAPRAAPGAEIRAAPRRARPCSLPECGGGHRTRGSPTTGKPMCARCTRIWWVRPVSRVTRTSVCARKRCADAIVGHRGTPVGPHRHARALACGGGRCGCIDRAAGGQHAGAHRQVLAADRARSQRCDERGVRLGGARHHQQAARVLVEPVHECRRAARARAADRARAARFAACARALPAPGCTTSPARLVDHEQRQRSRNTTLSGSASAVTRRRQRQPRRDAHLLAAEHPVLAAQRPAVDLHRARLDPARQPRPRILRQGPRQRLVEAQSGGLRGQRERVRTELRCHRSRSEVQPADSLYSRGFRRREATERPFP